MRPSATNNGSASSPSAQFDWGPVIVVGATVLVFRWLIPMVSSLWIDELGTFWVIDGDLGSTMDRAWRFHGQTPLYYTILWATTKVFGSSEFVMRLPSLLAMLGATVVLFRMTKRLYDRNTALLATAAFVVIPSVAEAAGDARPYAVAMLAAIVATDLLDRWHRNPRMWLAAGYGLAAAAVVYSHYVFATILIAHFGYHAWRLRRFADWPSAVRQTAVAGATFAVALSPTIPQVAALLRRRDELTFSSTPAFDDLIAVWVLPVTTVLLLGVLAWRLVRAGPKLQLLPANPTVLVALGFAIPPITLFLMGQLTDVVLWTRRYWMVAFPFGAILVGALLSTLLESHTRVRRGVLVILVLGVLSTTSFNHSSEDWRGAVAALNSEIDQPTTPVLLYANLIEATNPEFLEDEERRSYLASPATYYSVEGEVIPMPWAFPTDTFPERVDPILASLRDAARVLVVANRSGGATATSYLSGWMVARGYEIASQSSHGLVVVTTFQRAPGG